MHEFEFMPDGIEVLRRLGYRFSLDWDDELLIDSPASIPLAAVNQFVGTLREPLKHELVREQQTNLRRCNGGPYHGQILPGLAWLGPGLCKPICAGRAKWAVYRVDDHRRPHFIGYAKSQAKGRRGHVYERAAIGATS
jgi:hypothetical protein